MKLQIEVPDETWGVNLTIVATNKQDGSNMISTIFDPKEKVTIVWQDKKHMSLIDIKE